MTTTKLELGKAYPAPPPTTLDPATPTFCPFEDKNGDDCDGWTFYLIGKVGDLTFWRCATCGKDFARKN